MSLFVDVEKALPNFTLRVTLESEGGVLGILGASGCGKSMTLKCIAGVIQPDRGRIVLDGETLFDSEARIDLPPQKRQVGYLFQNYALFPNMTVEQNILCPLRGNPDRRALLRNAVELLQLEGLEKRRPHQLSGGQQQRAALARILVTRPRLLLLDEPFSALDSHLRDRLQVEMKQLLSSFDGQALLVTHSRDEAYHLSAAISVMDGGRILTTRETHALFADPGSVPAALLTGCKNVAPGAARVDEHMVDVPGWGVRLTTALPVREDVAAVAVRAHHFSPEEPRNRFPVTSLPAIEEPFEEVRQFRYAGQDPEIPPLWYRRPKDRGEFTALGVPPEAVLPLYPA